MDPNDVLRFWVDEVGPEGWYDSSEKLDAEVRNLFEPAWQQLKLGSFSLWLTYPTGALAYIIWPINFRVICFAEQAWHLQQIKSQSLLQNLLSSSLGICESMNRPGSFSICL